MNSTLLIRRDFVKVLAVAPLLYGAPSSAGAPKGWEEFWRQPRSLWLRRAGSSDELRAVYYMNGSLVSAGYEEICRFLRDVHTGEAVYMDPRLLDLLFVVHGYQISTASLAPIRVTNAYESKSTNRRLVASHGASKTSRHMSGQAVDIANPEVAGDALYRYMLWVGGGGVGHYPDTGHLHIDTGPRRTWVARRVRT